ncbi:MAG: hypothetical protein H0T13_05670 [Actinobacteria bacterium]|nr:hypothetical protein [Actinomycetota bacterium]
MIGTIAFWAVLLGAISLAVSVLGIEALTNFVAAIYAYLPNVLAALLIFLVASAISAAVATIATKAMGDTALGKIVATAAPILVMTIATFMILDQLMIAEPRRPRSATRPPGRTSPWPSHDRLDAWGRARTSPAPDAAPRRL